jgi:hypothetical protein
VEQDVIGPRVLGRPEIHGFSHSMSPTRTSGSGSSLLIRHQSIIRLPCVG